MNKYSLLFFLLFFIANQGFCQISELKGKVESHSRKDNLAGAFVSCTDKDGSVKNTTTDADGEFKFKNMPPGSYTLRVE